MSTRNPMNERYTSDEHKGVSRKSAAKAKPATSAHNSVVIQSTELSPKEKKAKRKQQEAEANRKRNEVAAKYYAPNTPEYKKWKKAWWGGLIGAMVMVALSWLLRSVEPYWISLVVLGLAYVVIIFAFWVDIAKIKKITNAYRDEMVKKEAEEAKKNRGKTKAQKEAEKLAEEERLRKLEEERRANSPFAKLRKKAKKNDSPADKNESSSADKDDKQESLADANKTNKES